MKNLKSRRLIYVILSVVVLILSALPIVMREDAAITRYSNISIVFAFCSVVYAVVAILLKKKGNLFTIRVNNILLALMHTLDEDKSYTKSIEYKKEFELSAFIFCVTIPAYITFAFFANGFYSALSQALGWTIFRVVAIIIVAIILPLIKRIKENKQQRIKDEAERKEQENRESMGKWK